MTLDQYAKEQAAQAFQQGVDKATDRMNILITKLTEAGRAEELAASAKDSELQKMLFEELGI